jgi:hypothetical protein
MVTRMLLYCSLPLDSVRLPGAQSETMCSFTPDFHHGRCAGSARVEGSSPPRKSTLATRLVIRRLPKAGLAALG